MASIAELLRPRLKASELEAYTRILEEELRTDVRGEIDEEAAAAKQPVSRNRSLRAKSLAQFERYLRQLQTYLRGEAVSFDDIDIPLDVAPPLSGLHLHDAPSASRVAWIADGPKVPVEVAASGPKVIALAALHAEREARLHAEAVAASARAELSDNEALIAHLELRIEKLKRELYGQRSERTARLIEQLELELE